MKKMLKEMRKYAAIYRLFIKNSLMGQMEYRFNFFMGILVETAYLFAKFLYVIVVYQTGVRIEGLPPDAILLFVGTYTALTGLYWGLFAVNFIHIPEHVRAGTLELYMTKPISLQFMTTLRHVDFGLAIPNLLGGFVMVVVGWKRLGMETDWIAVGGYLLFLVVGLLITYAVFLIPQLLSFWVVKTSAVDDISNALWDFNNMPMSIYTKWVQRIGVFLVPIFIITNFSPLFMLGQLKHSYAWWALIAPVIALGITRMIWSRAVRNYNSASS